VRNVDQQRIAEWIGDAFAILCVRGPAGSEAETNLRRGFEAILRELGSSPLRVLAGGKVPMQRPVPASTGDLRQIIKALDSCLAAFGRYDPVLTTAQRKTQVLIRATRRYAEEELAARHPDVPAIATSV
jgi:hypothetical protein